MSRPIPLAPARAVAAASIAAAVLLAAPVATAQNLPKLTREAAPGTAAPSAPSGSEQAAPATASPSGSPGVVTQLPSEAPVVFVEPVPLREGEKPIPGTQRVRAKFASPFGYGPEAERTTDVLVRGVMEVTPLDETTDGAEGPVPLSRGAITWNSIMRPDANRMVQLSSPLASQFKSAAEQIAPPAQVRAQGDLAGVLDGVRKLYSDDGEGTEPIPSEEAQAAPSAEGGGETQGGEVPQRASSPEGGRTPLTSSGVGQPGSESEFKVPETVTKTETVEAAPVVGTTTDGCTARVDKDNNVVVVQSRLSKNGVAEGECSDTSDRFPLQKSYSACNDIVDKEAGTANAAFRRYWVDSGGNTTYVDGECVEDSELEYTLVEEESACAVNVDIPGDQVIIQSQRVYEDRTGATKVVDGCRPHPEKDPIEMVTTTVGCELRHDFDAGVSYKRERKTYDLGDGIERTAQACADTETTYTHTKVSDKSVCSADIDLSDGTALRQYRMRITVDGVDKYVSECAPDADTQENLVKDTAVCAGSYIHQQSAGQSFGTAKWKHSLYGVEEYVTGCEQDVDTVYTHQTEITDYAHNDTTKTSRPLTRIYFDGPNGEVEVSGGQVRDGAPELAYVLDTQATRNTGEVEYEGCDRYNLRAEYNIYDRPDDTKFEEKVADAPRAGPTNACSVKIEQEWHKITDHGWSQRSTCRGSWNLFQHGASYTARRDLVREDGTVIVDDQSKTYTQSWCSPQLCSRPDLWQGRANDTMGGGYFLPSEKPCPATTSPDMTWVQQQGWTQP